MSLNSTFQFAAAVQPNLDDQDVIYANGVYADTGLPLCQLDVAEIAEIAIAQSTSVFESERTTAKYLEAENRLGTIGDVADTNNLSEAGWGIVFPARASEERKQALLPLIEHRKRQVLEQCNSRDENALFRVFEHEEGVRPGESCAKWLARHGVSWRTVDPLEGVPFYLLLVGSPQEIPFEFQYELDLYWGVGRLSFDDPADYRRYAESVVSYEIADNVAQAKSCAIFAPRHAADRATQMFADWVAQRLAFGNPTNGRPSIGQRQGFAVHPMIGDAATKRALNEIFRGTACGGPPALLLTGTHGMGFSSNDGRLPDEQGALLCQDWPGWGMVKSDHWFAARDLPADAQLRGLIHFCFACYGAGCPELDNYVVKPGQQPQRIAPRALVAKLPQKLLAHPGGGALAILGHVDRAWATSFASPGIGPQLQDFRDVIGSILRGDRLGNATDRFDIRRAALSFEWLELQHNASDRSRIPNRKIASLWTARNDARNYIIVGDPAVRLRVADL